MTTLDTFEWTLYATLRRKRYPDVNTEQMRQAILAKYPSERMRQRVSKMGEQQVFAFYTRLQNDNKKKETKR